MFTYQNKTTLALDLQKSLHRVRHMTLNHSVHTRLHVQTRFNVNTQLIVTYIT